MHGTRLTLPVLVACAMWAVVAVSAQSEPWYVQLEAAGGTQKLVAFALPDGRPLAPQGRATPSRAEEGKELAKRVCTSCHGLDTVTESGGRSREAWASVVNEMIGLGAAATDSEAAAIVDYLSREFPAQR
jgi:mono/diheme cytochrome c family protein